MERYGMRNMTQSYFIKSQGVILVCDTGEVESLNDLASWIDTARDYTDSSLVLSLWANNTGNGSNPLEDDAIMNFAAKHGIASNLVFEVSASSGDNLTDSYRKVVDAIHLTNINPRLAREVYKNVDLSHPEPPRSRWHKCNCY